jgi:hypothetical protein
MKVFPAIALAAVTTLCVGDLAAAQERGPHSKVGVAVKVGTMGVGVDAALPVLEKANVRFGVNTFTLNRDFDNDDGTSIAASLRMRSISASFDYFPFGGGFHLSPGIMLYNGNRASAVMIVPPGDSFDLGDQEYYSDPANPVTASYAVGFAKVAPSLVLGWGNIVPHGDRRWSIPVEFGIVYSGAPKTTLGFAGSACNRNGANCRSIATDSTLQADLAQEQVNVDKDLSRFKLLPILSFGFSYKF